MADEAKAKGNAAFAAGRFDKAVQHFSDAVALAPDNHVLYSNRSAAYASLHRYAEALADAESTVALKPDWTKGYSRLGVAHLGLGDHAKAVEAYEKGLSIEPSNEALKSGLAQARQTSPRRPPASGADGIGKMFQGPELWSRIAADPTTRGYLDQPDFMQMLREVQRNPSSLNNYLSDPRMVQVLSLMLNIKLPNQNNGAPETAGQSTPPPPKQQPEAKAREPEPMEITEEEKERKERKATAQKEKEVGNAAYKKKDFETAIQQYTKAMEIDDEDISYITNRAAVYLEMGKVSSLPFGTSTNFLAILLEDYCVYTCINARISIFVCHYLKKVNVFVKFHNVIS
jgi:stress-induced-phosphoprotein 1